MLYKDDVRVSLANTADKNGDGSRLILQELQQFANSKGIVKFKLLPGMKNPGIFLPLMAKVASPTGGFIMCYATSVQKKGDQIVYTPTTLRWPPAGTVDLNRDPELAIFLYGYSTLCKNGKNPNKSHTTWFMVEDAEHEAAVITKSRLNISKVTNFVLEPIDDGGVPLQMVVNYGKSKGLRFSGDESEKVVRTRVFEVIEKMNLFEEFTASITSRKFFEYSDLIDQATELGALQVMRLKNDNINKGWRFISTEGELGDIIRKVPIHGNARAHLLDEMDQNSFLVSKIREITEIFKLLHSQRSETNPKYKIPQVEDPEGNDLADDVDELLDALVIESEPEVEEVIPEVVPKVVEETVEEPGELMKSASHKGRFVKGQSGNPNAGKGKGKPTTKKKPIQRF